MKTKLIPLFLYLYITCRFCDLEEFGFVVVQTYGASKYYHNISFSRLCIAGDVSTVLSGTISSRTTIFQFDVSSFSITHFRQHQCVPPDIIVQ